MTEIKTFTTIIYFLVLANNIFFINISLGHLQSLLLVVLSIQMKPATDVGPLCLMAGECVAGAVEACLETYSMDCQNYQQ